MPKNTTVTQIGEFKLTRPITPFLANKLQLLIPAIIEANANGLSLSDASAATGIEHNNLNNYVAILGIKWANKRTYKPRRKPSVS